MANEEKKNRLIEQGRYGRTVVSDTTAHTPADSTYVYGGFLCHTAGAASLCTEAAGNNTHVGAMSDLTTFAAGTYTPLDGCSAFTGDGTLEGVLWHEPA